MTAGEFNDWPYYPEQPLRYRAQQGVGDEAGADAQIQQARDGDQSTHDVQGRKHQMANDPEDNHQTQQQIAG